MGLCGYHLPIGQCSQLGDWVAVCSDPFFFFPVSSPYEGYIFVAGALRTAVSERSGLDIRELMTTEKSSLIGNSGKGWASPASWVSPGA